MVSPLAAAKAYAAVQGDGASKPVGSPPVDDGPNFGDVLKNMVQETVNTSRAAETQMANHTVGKAELVDVVTAVSSAQASLETVMAIRDQVISAYQEVMRMPI
jgi:flagellar hook-basal body complex protein FliE